MAGVVLENVSRVYPGGVAAVEGVGLEVFDREFLVLVGPSGCGKTTTLRLIAGLEDLSGGRITIGSRVVNDVPPKDRDIAMVFQNYALYPHLTVYRNMAFGLELREGVRGAGWLWRWALPSSRRREWIRRRADIAARVRETAGVLGIGDLLDRYPRQLSGGERQRVALGRAIVRNPAVFLFDEPLSNLDAKLRVEMRRELKQLHRRLQTTMIYVTHDQVEALTLGQRIVVMNEGTVQQVGPPMDVYDWPANRFVAGFIGTPAMNFIEGQLSRNDRTWCFRRGDWSLELAPSRVGPGSSGPRPAVLGVRPEHVGIAGQPPGPSATPAVVRMVEMLGDATVASLEITTTSGQGRSADGVDQDRGFEVQSKLGARSDLQPGDRVTVEIDASQAHVFDPATGENWVRRAAAA
jgi:multiple sugar transport system ATP-binding protein